MCLQGLADLEAIADAIKKSGITQVELGLEEFKQVSAQSVVFLFHAFDELVDIDPKCDSGNPYYLEIVVLGLIINAKFSTVSLTNFNQSSFEYCSFCESYLFNLSVHAKQEL